MKSVQSSNISGSAKTYEQARRRETRRRRTRFVSVCGFTFLLLLCIAIIPFWLLNPDHLINGSNRVARIEFWAVSPPHLLLTCLWLASLLVCPFLIAAISGKPTAILLYILNVQKRGKPDHKLYTMLSSIDNADQTPQPVPENQGQEVQPHLQKMNKHLLVLGLPGAGKTKTLLAFQHNVLKKWWRLIWGREKLPIYIAMNSYNLYLKEPTIEQEKALLNYVMYESASTGMPRLRPYLGYLLKHGKIVLLFDGLNEVDSNFLPQVCDELKRLMALKLNRVIITCRDIDFREQEVLQTLVADMYAEEKLLLPLRVDEIEGFIQRYIDVGYVDEDKMATWQYTAQQIKQKIDQTDLSEYCTNPLILYTMMRTLNGASTDKEVLLNTRGRLLREFVSQLMETAAKKPNWRRNPPNRAKEEEEQKEIVWLLGEIACNARRINARNAIRLVNESPITGGKSRKIPLAELAGSLPAWLENPNPDPNLDFPVLADLQLRSLPVEYDMEKCERYLRFARDATLIRVDDNGEIRFRHELIAEYFVAEYLLALGEENKVLDAENEQIALPFIDEILDNQASWSQSVALWAGMLPDPRPLAKRLAACVKQPLDKRSRSALVLSLTSIGVVWKSPHKQQEPQKISLPGNLYHALEIALPDVKIRQELAHTIRKSAEEGGREIYHVLLPLLSSSQPGIIQLLLLINDRSIIYLLFDYLKEVVDKPLYEKHLDGTIRAIGQFGKDAILEALPLSSPTSTNSNMRCAAIRILGHTHEQSVVAPLITYLKDNGAEKAVLEEVVATLVILGTDLVLEPLIKEIQSSTTPPLIKARAYSVLKGWLEQMSQLVTIDLALYRQIIELNVPFIGSGYPSDLQIEVMSLFLAQVNLVTSDHRGMHVIYILLQHLSTDDNEMKENIITTIKRTGSIATSQLREYLQPRIAEVIRLRVVDILKDEPRPEALPDLLQLLADQSQKIQEKVKLALQSYAPASIPGLIQRVVSPQFDNMVVFNAAEVLKNIGKESVGPITQTLATASSDRVRVLVRILMHIHSMDAIPSLITLLKASQQDLALTLFLVEEAFSQFADERIVITLLELLRHAEPTLQKEISKTLSLVGYAAFSRLIAALDVEPTETLPSAVQFMVCVRNALITMKPFPKKDLVTAFADCSNAAASHISQIFLAKDADSAEFLVDQLCHTHPRTRTYVRQTVDKMDGRVLISPLLGALQRGTNCPGVVTFLLKFPESIPQLVQLLDDARCSQATHDVLVEFGPRVIHFLLPALEKQDQLSQRQAKNLIVVYTQQDKKNLLPAIRLFSPIATQNKLHARQAMLDVLIHDLSPISVELLLDELRTTDIHVQAGVSDALVRLVREDEKQKVPILNELLKTLHRSELRDGTEITLIKLKEIAVPKVGQLVTDKIVGKSAQHILAEIGPPAFHFIWAAYSNMHTPELREAARNIFRAMATAQVKDDLIRLLISEKREDVEMAFTLLIERIHEDALSVPGKQRMIPALIEQVQMSNGEDTNRRILAFLLLQQKDLVIEHMVQGLQLHPQRSEWLIPTFLLLGMAGNEAKMALHRLLQLNTSPKLLAEVNSVLGMMEAHPEVVKKATEIGHVTQLEQEEIEIALRALGGLLAGGKWNAATLQSRRYNSDDVSIENELYSLLLGKPYAPRFDQAQRALKDEQRALKAEQQARQEETEQFKDEIEKLEQAVTQANRAKEEKEQQVRQLKREKAALEEDRDGLKSRLNTLRRKYRA